MALFSPILRLADGVFGSREYGTSSRSLTAGGVRNQVTGLGGPVDHTEASFYVPTVIRHRDGLQTFVAQSWIADRFISMPIDDMFMEGRSISEEDDAAHQAFTDEWEKFEVEDRISGAMKAGRTYGTGLACIITQDGALESPLEVERIREGDLASILTYDRFDAHVKDYTLDLYDNQCYRPEMYTIHPRFGMPQFDIHASRVIRFDGRRPMTSQGWSGVYDREWGLSELISAVNEILYDASLVGGIAHLAQEASMLVMKIDSFSDAIMGDVGQDAPSVSQLASAMNMFKSIFRTIFTDKEVDVERVNYDFSGMHELMMQFAQRLAAIAGIPFTRFMAQSPAGQNATGESDMRNYAIHVAALQRRLLTKPLRILDGVIARHIGLSKPLEYEFRPLMDLSAKEKAEVDKLKTETILMPVVQGAILDENEARERLSEMELFGELPALPEDELAKNTPEGIDPETGAPYAPMPSPNAPPPPEPRPAAGNR